MEWGPHEVVKWSIGEDPVLSFFQPSFWSVWDVMSYDHEPPNGGRVRVGKTSAIHAF
jgi:hypothetical protein